MKVISTETSYVLHETLGLSASLDLPLNSEVEVSDKDAVVLLSLPGVVKAQTELLSVKEEIKSLPTKQSSIKE